MYEQSYFRKNMQSLHAYPTILCVSKQIVLWKGTNNTRNALYQDWRLFEFPHGILGDILCHQNWWPPSMFWNQKWKNWFLSRIQRPSLNNLPMSPSSMVSRAKCNDASGFDDCEGTTFSFRTACHHWDGTDTRGDLAVTKTDRIRCNGKNVNRIRENMRKLTDGLKCLNDGLIWSSNWLWQLELVTEHHWRLCPGDKHVEIELCTWKLSLDHQTYQRLQKFKMAKRCRSGWRWMKMDQWVIYDFIVLQFAHELNSPNHVLTKGPCRHSKAVHSLCSSLVASDPSDSARRKSANRTHSPPQRWISKTHVLAGKKWVNFWCFPNRLQVVASSQGY